MTDKTTYTVMIQTALGDRYKLADNLSYTAADREVRHLLSYECDKPDRVFVQVDRENSVVSWIRFDTIVRVYLLKDE